jgi:hypothetical protein
MLEGTPMNLSKLRRNMRIFCGEKQKTQERRSYVPDDKPKPVHGLVLCIVATTQVDQTEDHAHEQEDKTATNVKDRVTDD